MRQGICVVFMAALTWWDLSHHRYIHHLPGPAHWTVVAVLVVYVTWALFPRFWKD